MALARFHAQAAGGRAMEPSQAKENWQPARSAPWNTTPQTDLG